MKNPRRRKNMNELARKLSLEDGDIVLIKSGTGLANKDNIKTLTENLGRMGYYKTLVIVVDGLDDLQILNESGMNAHGWFRKEEESNNEVEITVEPEQSTQEEG